MFRLSLLRSPAGAYRRSQTLGLDLNLRRYVSRRQLRTWSQRISRHQLPAQVL
jgi:hypothetical protein